MSTLLMILLMIFAGVALMAFLVERFAKPMEPERMARISRWILPLAAGVILVQIIAYVLR